MTDRAPEHRPRGARPTAAYRHAHSALLCTARFFAALVFVQIKVMPAPKATSACSLGGTLWSREIELQFDCGGSPKRIFETGKVVLP